MRARCTGFVAFVLALWCGAAAAKEVSVTLQDGTELHGEMVERKPHDHLVIKLPTGEVRRLEQEEIKRVDEPVVRVEPASNVEVIVVADRPHVRLEVLRTQARPGVGFIPTVSPRIGAYGTTYPGTGGLMLPTTNIVETWHPVCSAPCTERVDAEQSYRLTGDDVVSSGTFVIERQPAVRVKGTMGSTTERGGAPSPSSSSASLTS